MPAIRRFEGGVVAGQLLVAAGLLTLLNNWLPGSDHLNLPVLYATGGAAVLLGLISLRIPWRRLPMRAPLLLTLPAFALIALSNAYGGPSPYSYAVFFIVVFVWAGIAQPPGTSLLLAIPATAAYLAPAAALHGQRPMLATSTSVAIPVCVLVGELLARTTDKHERALQQLRHRIQMVERLAALSTQVGRDLEPHSVGEALVDCAADLFDGRAVFAKVDEDDVARVVAMRGLERKYLEFGQPVSSTSIAAAATDPRGVAVRDDPDSTTLPLPPGGCVATVACRTEGRLLGGLTVLLDRPADAVDDETLDVLRVLGSQAEVALLNADRHRRLLEQRRHEEAIVDTLVDGLIVLGPDDTVRTCNDAAANLLGWTPDKLLGHPLPIGVEAGETVENEIEPGIWIETSAVALPGSSETVVALRDVSRQHALDAAKDLFLATSSHELRTPLTAIKGYLATLQRHWDSFGDTERRRALSIVEDQTNALVRLADHLLLGARAATTPRPAVPYDLGELVRVTATAYAEVSTRHTVIADVPERLPLAVGDPDSVRSILAQLIENAVKYSPNGGEIRVAVGTGEGSDRLVVDVLDRGVGLPAGGSNRLFEPFSQGDAPNTRTFSGVGLGLYIVRRLVEGQGGEVSALPRSGGGSDFRFTLPVSPVPSPRRTESVPAPA